MSLRIEIDTDRCTGHGRCYMLAPDLFDADDDGYAVVTEPMPDQSHRADALTAVGNCPERAIRVGRDA